MINGKDGKEYDAVIVVRSTTGGLLLDSFKMLAFMPIFGCHADI
jgi:hypothetical protein